MNAPAAVAVAAVFVACTGSARKEKAAPHRDAVPVPGACSHDVETCPGTCNVAGYCEVDGEFGPEVRLPPARYAVDFEERAHLGIMNKDPALLVLAEPLWVSKRESSVGDYRRCKACAPKAFLDGQADDAPLELSFVDAQAFCKATGRRLATPEEWQAAARGPSPCTDPLEVRDDRHGTTCNFRRYPWGDDQTPAALCKYGYNSVCEERTGPHPIGPHPDYASPTGVEDLSGNVEEWVDGFYEGRPGVKGGGWGLLGREPSELWLDLGIPGTEYDDYQNIPNPIRLGVRCVRGNPKFELKLRPAPI
ncbi:MAG: SUMF1/EgtB/PvdO family nonheme iron enzyme [Myxococcales bacterium]|nr:SUMF1/EgtB/PvdO family nonheme iron enzyme [Myxococcales bacterium]